LHIIRTDVDDLDALGQFEKDQCYNGLDCCVTLEAYEKMVPQLDEHTARTYAFSKSLQAPVLEMGTRGVLVDQYRKAQVIEEYSEMIERLEAQLNQIIFNGVGLAVFNWRSPKDLQYLFYTRLELEPIRKMGKVTCDREAREKLEIYPIAEQILKHINLLTELGDKVSVLRTGIDPDGRIRTSYNIAGTSTGRFSSSASTFGTGGNLQNVEEKLRSIFISDPGMKFAKMDAKSGESFCVGAVEWNILGDSRYLDACETGDPHTASANLGWVGNLKEDKAIAEQLYYRDHSYRFMCKKLGHGSSYGGQPATIAAQARIPVQLVETFQTLYFKAFPHQQWHAWVANELKTKGYLISLTGRKRWFFKRRTEPKTLREALAYDPQGSLADIVNQAMIKLWRMGFTIVMHDHDALTFMYPERDEDKIISQLMDNIVVPVELNGGRTLRIPYDCKVGWNKADYSSANPDGLKDYHGHDDRKRSKVKSLLDKMV